jgi:Zn-finger nucleic acid-binding protein
MSARICPKCSTYSELAATTVDASLTVDRCEKCRGVWLDWDELGPAKDLKALLPLFSQGASVTRDQARGNCPSCAPSVELARIPVGAFGVDRGPSCEGLWFDGGELGSMLTEQGFAALLKALRANP